jgi:ribosome-associated toxin RatA of RatAB toxin-antitoxin module
MEISNQITMRGDWHAIYDYAAGVERWPELLPHYRHVDILEPGERDRLVSMHCVRRFGVLNWPCKWRARQELKPEEGRILFTHVSGPARGMHVEWLLEHVPCGVQATIRHWVEVKRPPWTRFYFRRIVGPVFVQAIAQRTLTTIKDLVEGRGRV